jgi:hypothetical protein
LSSSPSDTPRRIPALSVLAMTFAGGIARSSTLVSQIIVGNFLTEREVGTYAVAVGVTGFTVMLRGGGASHYLPTISQTEFDTSAGRIFWWGFWFRIFAALATFAVAFALPQLGLDDPPPRLAETLEVFALSQIFLAFSVVGRIRMAVLQRFTALARLDIANAFFRVGATAVLAWLGAGPLALVIPIAMAPAIECVYYLFNGTLGSIQYRWSGGTVRETAALMWWPLVVSIVLSLNSQSNFLVVKPMLALASMGVYYFAYQLASQPTMMLTGPLTNVLATHFAKERGNPAREAQAVIHTTSGAVLFSSLLCCMLIAVFPATERMLWGGKWADANVSIIALAGAGCWLTAVGLLSSALAGLQRYKAMASFEALKGLGIFAGAALGAVLVGMLHRGELGLPTELFGNYLKDEKLADSTIVSIATGLCVALMSMGQLAWLLLAHNARFGTVLRTVLQGPLLGAAAAVGAMLGGVALSAALLKVVPINSLRAQAMLEFLATTVLYALIAIAIVRVTSVGALRDAVALLPSRPQGLATRLLRL